MYQSIERKFAAAVASGSLKYTATQQFPHTSHGVSVVYSIAPALAHKPEGAVKPAAPAAAEAAKAAEAAAGAEAAKAPAEPRDDAATSPWLPPEADLLVESVGAYNVVLNKFAVAKYHFLLVTQQFARQTAPLSEADWAAALGVLRAANRESGKRHIGFFNSGPYSGASQPHKHLQFLTLPENFAPFPDSTPKRAADKVTADERVPYSHYIVNWSDEAKADASDGAAAAETAANLLSNVFTKCAEFESHPVSYNLVFTEEWLLATPRRRDAVDGLSINALGTVGLLLAKTDEQLKTLETRGLDLVAELGFPFAPVEPFSLEINHKRQY